MQPVPRIFVSATSRDLRTARGLVSEGLRRMECLPIVQDDFPPDYKSVRDMLRTKLEACDAVVHLAGFYYGAEPQPVLDGPERRSFTQMEYEMAVELGLPCYVFLCGEKFPFDEHEPEPEDKRALQMAHRARLLERDELYYEFDSREDLNSRTRELQLSVESLRGELAKERARRRMTLIVAAAALLVAVAGGIFLFSKTQSQEAVIAETASKLDEQSTLIEQLLAEQARLRAERGDVSGIAELAEENVAKRANVPVEEIRAEVQAAVRTAEEAVAAARTGSGAGAQLAEAEALLQLAEAQLAAGRKTEAITAYRERLSLLNRENFPVEWAETAGTLGGLLFWRDVESSEPREILSEGVEWAHGNPKLGPDHPATLAMMLPLSVMVGKDEALALASHVLAVRDRELGPDDPASLDAALVLARRHKVEDQFEEADALFERVIATRARLYGETDLRTLEANWDLANSYESQGRFNEAEDVLTETIRLSSEAHGEGSESTLSFSAGLGFLYDRQGKTAAATGLFRRGVAASEEFNGMDTDITQSLMNNLAVRMVEIGDYVEAEKLARRVLDSRIRTIGVNQALTIDSMGTLALALEKQGDIAAYREITEEKIAAQIAVFGADSPKVAADQFSLGLSLLADGDPEAGKPFLEASYQLSKAVNGPNAPATLNAIKMLGVLAVKTDDWTSAEKWSREGLKQYETLDNPDWQGMAQTYYRLALSLESLGKTTEAIEAANDAADLAVEHFPVDHWLHPEAEQLIERLENDGGTTE